MHFIRVMPDHGANASRISCASSRRAARSGSSGRSDQSIGSDQLCYGKDASGAWKIVGMIGGE